MRLSASLEASVGILLKASYVDIEGENLDCEWQLP